MSDIERRNLDILEQHFRDGCKLNCIQKLGVEIEHFIVHEDTGASVTYYEECGVEYLLHEIESYYPRHYYKRENICWDYITTTVRSAQSWNRPGSWRSALSPKRAYG